MIVWFLVLAVSGVIHIADDPTVLAAINPWYGISFMLSHGVIALVTLGAVFLAVTGGEALYADLGHFGRRPIQAAWLGFVLPSLLLNYFGQGALLLSNPAAIENPFYRMVPDFLLMPLVILATAATVIASQAVITGAFSMVRQAVQLSLVPRFEVRHTSEIHFRPDLSAARELAADDRRAGAGGDVPHLERPRCRLRHRRVHDDGCGRHHGLRGGLEAVGMASGDLRQP